MYINNTKLLQSVKKVGRRGLNLTLEFVVIV